jgi:hypothetical protein
MAPKMGIDADGDIPPCSAMWDLEGAKAWDAFKQEKYGGAQKAGSMVEAHKRYVERCDRSKKMVEAMEAAKPPAKYISASIRRIPEAPPLPPRRTWWQRVTQCFC